MSHAASTNGPTATVVITEPGTQGPAGLVWRGDWTPGVEYLVRDAVYHDGTSYRVTGAHTASTATEPGVGEDWQSVWQVLALGTDVETAEKVAGIADAIETVADISEAIQIAAAADAAIRTVADRDADIATVANAAGAVEITAGIAAKVETVADNSDAVVLAADKMDAIEAAPGAARDAGESAEASQDWAEGTEPGGPGTKSSKEYASDAAGSAATAAAATLVGYGVSIYNEDGIDAGGYYAERRATTASEQTEMYAEIINGDVGSSVDVTVMVGGAAAHGPVTVTQGTPLTLSGLSINVGASDGVSFMITPSPGVRELFLKTYGAVV